MEFTPKKPISETLETSALEIQTIQITPRGQRVDVVIVKKMGDRQEGVRAELVGDDAGKFMTKELCDALTKSCLVLIQEMFGVPAPAVAKSALGAFRPK